MSVTDDLIKARALISDPSNWTTKALARDRELREVSVYSEEACKFCAIGAIQRVTGSLFSEARTKLADKCYELYRSSLVADLNDFKGHAAVIELFDKTIGDK